VAETREHGDAAQHMDGIYRYQRYIYDATRKYYLLGRDRMLERLAPPPGARVLEIGCGTGRNLILAARRYPNARFYGFDISRVMLETAEKAIAREALSGRITVAQGDATDFDVHSMFGEPHVERAFISYSLSMIPPWQAAVREGIDVLAPGGELHVVDFGQQEGWPRWFERLMAAWLAKFSVYPRADLEAELARAAEAAGATLEFEKLYRDYARYAKIARPTAEG
jgi:S-adenosylmethionine-diacylgycerolhomoserine-N-methlytransferase